MSTPEWLKTNPDWSKVGWIGMVNAAEWWELVLFFTIPTAIVASQILWRTYGFEIKRRWFVWRMRGRQ